MPDLTRRWNSCDIDDDCHYNFTWVIVLIVVIIIVKICLLIALCTFIRRRRARRNANVIATPYQGAGGGYYQNGQPVNNLNQGVYYAQDIPMENHGVLPPSYGEISRDTGTAGGDRMAKGGENGGGHDHGGSGHGGGPGGP